MKTIAELMAGFRGPGELVWIGARPERGAPMLAMETAEVTMNGIRGDRNGRPGRRAVTLIQAEHLDVIAALQEIGRLDPGITRRNLVVKGINLIALKTAVFTIGNAGFRGTGPCEPCSRMEAALGHGGYNAMRGHGGITAEIISPGTIRLGDSVIPAAGRMH